MNPETLYQSLSEARHTTNPTGTCSEVGKMNISRRRQKLRKFSFMLKRMVSSLLDNSPVTYSSEYTACCQEPGQSVCSTGKLNSSLLLKSGERTGNSESGKSRGRSPGFYFMLLYTAVKTQDRFLLELYLHSQRSLSSWYAWLDHSCRLSREHLPKASNTWAPNPMEVGGYCSLCRGAACAVVQSCRGAVCAELQSVQMCSLCRCAAYADGCAVCAEVQPVQWHSCAEVQALHFADCLSSWTTPIQT